MLIFGDVAGLYPSFFRKPEVLIFLAGNPWEDMIETVSLCWISLDLQVSL